MMWILMFFSFLFFSLKNFFFFSMFIFLDSNSIFMASISSLVIYLIYSFLFTYVVKLDLIYYLMIFFFVILIVTLSFFSIGGFFFICCLEMSVLPMVLLIFMFSKDLDKISSSFFMMFTNLFGSLPFMIFIFFKYSIDQLSIANLLGFYYKSWIMFFCFCTLLISKLPIFFFHFWLLKAHVSASGSCSMLLASLMLKLGSFGILKFSYLFSKLGVKMFSLLYSLSMWGSMILVIYMIRFFDLKNLIACSSILHMCMILPLVNSNNLSGVYASLLMMVGHGLVSYFLFFLISLVYEKSLSRSIDLGKCLESCSKFMSMVIFFCMFFNLGLPPFINFLSELIFCMFFFSFSLYSLFYFNIFMVLSMIFLVFFLTKILFGKKNIIFSEDSSMFLGSSFFYYFSFMMMLPFMIL